MATIKERPDSYCVRGIIKRDFQHDHSGPEEIPHRKKKNKKRKREKSDHKHLWETNGWEKKYKMNSVLRDKPDVWGNRWKYVPDLTKWMLRREFECLECGKRGKVQFQYPQGRPFYWYGW